MRVLVVDDDPFSLRMIVSILERNGISTVSFPTATLALRTLAKDTDFQLIISDVMMPHIDGFAFLRQLRHDRRLSRIPIILCTTLGDHEAIIKGVELGITDYVVKPIKADVLVPKVRAALVAGQRIVLIVDDEKLVRVLLTQIVERDGWQVISAEDGREALAKFAQYDVKLVVSDIKMPGMDGLELLANIKQLAPDLPVVLAAERGTFSREALMNAGAADVVGKPFHNMEILASISSHLK